MRNRTVVPSLGMCTSCCTYHVVVVTLLLVCGVQKVLSGTIVVEDFGGKATVTASAPERTQKGFKSPPPRGSFRNRLMGEDEDEDEDEDEENEYGGGVVPEDNENEIDCFAFDHMDDLPSFCLDIDGQPDSGIVGTNVPSGSVVTDVPVEGDDIVIPGAGNETSSEMGGVYPSLAPVLYPIHSPEYPNATLDDDVSSGREGGNSIWLPLSMAIFKPQDLSQSMTQAFVTSAVNVIGILLDRYTPYEVDLSQDSNEFGFEFVNHSDRRSLMPEDISQLEGDSGSHFDLQTRNGEPYGSTVQNTPPPYSPTSDYEPTITLRVAHVDVWKSIVWEDWIHFNVTYAVFWPDGDEMMHQSKLDFIESSCLEVLNTTVETGKFWAEMLEADQEARFVIREDMIWSNRDQSGIKAISKFGDESAMNQTKNVEPSIDNLDRSDEFHDPLETVWDIREWIGLGVCTFTIATVTFLTVVSARLHRLHTQKKAWGLTEQGVGELLNVGWKYQQEGSGLLFLKVYKKGRLGYNDDNSVLNGKVVETSAVQHTATTATTASQSSPQS